MGPAWVGGTVRLVTASPGSPGEAEAADAPTIETPPLPHRKEHVSEAQVVIRNNLESQQSVKEANRLFTNLDFFCHQLQFSYDLS